MTPLEEIEQAIATLLAEPVPRPRVAFAQQLATLYNARAIERLEATVRMIGVQLQEAATQSRESLKEQTNPYTGLPEKRR